MTQGTLLPNLSEVKLICLRPKDGAIQMELQACRACPCCPGCGTSCSGCASFRQIEIGVRKAPTGPYTCFTKYAPETK